MSGKLFAGAFAALVILSFAIPSFAQSTPAAEANSSGIQQAVPEESLTDQITALQQKATEAYEAEKWVAYYTANMKLNQILPYEPSYLINVVRACSMLDRKNTAYHYMHVLQQQGFSFDFNSIEETQNIRGTEAYDHINNLMIDAAKPAGEGAVMFTLPGNPSDYSAVAWDESRSRFLAGSLGDGTLYSVTAQGEAEILLKADSVNGLWSITGLAVDAKNKRLWVSSAVTPSFSGYPVENPGQSAVFEFHLDTLEPLASYPIPVEGLQHELGSLAVTDDGHVYVIDREAPIIFRKAPEGKLLEPFLVSADMFGFIDIATAPDNSRVFVTDPERGVLVIDPNESRAILLSGPENMNLGGVTNIEYRDSQLFVVQGSFIPQRILRLELDPSLGVVETVTPMAVALQEFDRPGIGTIRGDSLFYLANAGAKDASGGIVMSTSLAAGAEAVVPRLDKQPMAVKSEKQ